MPTYQYACTECGEQLEMVQKFSDDPLTACPACSGRLRKIFSPVGIVFKGSGFYRTDSRASNGAKDGAKDGKTTEAASSGSQSEGSGGKADKTGKADKADKADKKSSSSKESSSGASSPASSSGSTSEKVA